MPMIAPFAVALLLVLCSAAAEPLFPPASALDPALVMPPDSERIEIGADGTFRVGGRPRYLLGTVLYNTPSLAECAPGPGYAPENAWIYETIPDRDYLQRLGFDTVGGEVSTTWMQKFRPEGTFYQSRRVNDWSLASRYWKSGLPTIVDFTCAGWSHGAIKVEEGRAPSLAAIPKGGAGHFMPYSLVTPEGRDLYARMWRSGAEELRDHGIPAAARVAVLVSQPTERLGAVAGHGNHTFTRASALALERCAHLVTDAIFEEQLAEGRLDLYRFLVAAGIDATYPGTLPALRRWVEDGGTLVLAQEAMDLDEYGRPLPATGTDFPGIALGAPVAGEAKRFDFDGVEVQVARGADGAVGYVVINHGLTARAVLFRAEGSGDGAPAVARQEFHAEVAENKPMLHDITRRVCLGSNAEGFVPLLLEPDVPVVLRSRRCTGIRGTSVGHPCDPCETIAPQAAASPSVASVSSVRDSGAAATCPCETFDDVAARAPAWLAERRPKAVAKAFSVDSGRVRFLDLREVANRSYVDRVAGDGEGGWTDQGENHLRYAPWGPTDCNGVLFDFIRPDQNDERACVILRSTRQPYLPEAVRGIAANLRAEALYFLHAAAWLEKGKEAFRYVVHYAESMSSSAFFRRSARGCLSAASALSVAE